MSEFETIKSIDAVTLFQKWTSNKKPMPIGTKFLIKNQDKTITLIVCDLVF